MPGGFVRAGVAMSWLNCAGLTFFELSVTDGARKTLRSQSPHLRYGERHWYPPLGQ
jgi:hypothetical protein